MTHRSSSRGRRGGRGPGRRLQFLARRLDLSTEQMTELGERLGRHRAKGRELFLAHRAERLEIIRDVLDDEQSERFEAMLRRRAERHGRHRHRGRGHERPRPTVDESEDDVLA
ncbi:MAG: hypothetical protein AAFZ07_17685 [Actinomycetota bacterium]